MDFSIKSQDLIEQHSSDLIFVPFFLEPRLDDVVIGAPLYSKLNVKDQSYEKGRIYIAYQDKEVGKIHSSSMEMLIKYLCSPERTSEPQKQRLIFSFWMLVLVQEHKYCRELFQVSECQSHFLDGQELNLLIAQLMDMVKSWK